ncbi:MAG: hypothetical protein ABSB80_09370 [Methanoregula sp.]|uniref:hypothetical protein n=1 Tax=Methanoregula sp. TaxID=2052170 RepID=UPI003D0B5624
MVFLVCFLAFAQGALAATSATSATLTASQTDTIQITVTGTEAPWTLVPGTTFTHSPSSLSVVVNSTADWSVAASDTNTTTAGFMTSYAPDTYTPATHLTNALTVEATSGTGSGSYKTLPTGGNIVTGDAGTNQVSYGLGFQQVVSYADPVLSNPNVYRIVVTLTGTSV